MNISPPVLCLEEDEQSLEELSESANSWKGGTEELGLETRRPFMQEETYYLSEEEST